MRRLNGEDPTDFVYSQNIIRRHLAKGACAMLTAMMYPEAEKTHRGKKAESTGKLLETKSFSAARLSQARTVLRYLPETAKLKRKGGSLEPKDQNVSAARLSQAGKGRPGQ